MWKFILNVDDVIFWLGSPKRKTHKVHMNNDPCKAFKKYAWKTNKNCNSYGFMKIWLNLNHSKVLNYSTKFLYHLCAFSRLALAISHKRRLFSSSCVTIDNSSFASLGGCPCVAHIIGTIGDLPVTIWKGVEPVVECSELLQQKGQLQMVHPILLIHCHIIS